LLIPQKSDQLKTKNNYIRSKLTKQIISHDFFLSILILKLADMKVFSSLFLAFPNMLAEALLADVCLGHPWGGADKYITWGKETLFHKYIITETVRIKIWRYHNLKPSGKLETP
jgi:hypothetical protein